MRGGNDEDERINKHARLNNKKALLERPDMTRFKVQNNSQYALQKIGVTFSFPYVQSAPLPLFLDIARGYFFLSKTLPYCD